MAGTVDTATQAEELRGVIRGVKADDFEILQNGNSCIELTYNPSGYPNRFDVLFEYTPSFPDMPPKAWVQSPEIHPDTEHVWGRDEYGDVMICYIDPADWTPNLTSYDAAAMVKTWVFAYCNWREHGEWTWDEKAHETPDSSVFDLLPF